MKFRVEVVWVGEEGDELRSGVLAMERGQMDVASRLSGANSNLARQRRHTGVTEAILASVPG